MSDRASLIRWLRDSVTGLRLFERRLEDGTTVARALFTFRGESFDIELTGGAETLETVVQQAITAVQKRAGVRKDDEREEAERAIIEAALRGDTALADRLGFELATKNEGRGLPLRTTNAKWER